MMLMLVTREDPRLAEIVSKAVEGGVNVVQVRGVCDVHDVRAAVGERARVLIHGIDHLPESAPAMKAAGRSVHSVDAAKRAEAEGCEYVLAGSVFPTASHPGGPTGGLALVRDVAAAVRIPVVAIGGITAANARACIDAGAQGVAVISAIFDAPDPRAAAEELWRAIA
jgi:thiamine monophosphate synthase